LRLRKPLPPPPPPPPPPQSQLVARALPPSSPVTRPKGDVAAPTASLPYEPGTRLYFELTAALLQPGALLHSSLRSTHAQNWSVCTARAHFSLLGVEGAGHHVVWGSGQPPALALPLCSGGEVHFRRPGSSRGDDYACGSTPGSLPRGDSWRASPSSPLFSKNDEYNLGLGKAIVMLRDPVDTLSSALGRFWVPEHGETLDRELEAAEASYAKLQELITARSPSRCRLVIVYELLTRYPEAYRKPMARFLGVREDNPAVGRWLDGIRRAEGGVASRAYLPFDRQASGPIDDIDVHKLLAPRPMAESTVRELYRLGQKLQRFRTAHATLAQPPRPAGRPLPSPTWKPLPQFADVHASLAAGCAGSPLKCSLAWRQAWRERLVDTRAATRFPDAILSKQMSWAPGEEASLS